MYGNILEHASGGFCKTTYPIPDIFYYNLFIYIFINRIQNSLPFIFKIREKSALYQLKSLVITNPTIYYMGYGLYTRIS